MSAIPTNPKLSDEEIAHLGNYVISCCKFDSSKFISSHPQYGSKVFLNKCEFKSTDASKKLKPLTAFFELLYTNLLNDHNINWKETSKHDSYYLKIDDFELFQKVIAPFEDMVLVNDTLDLTICSDFYYKSVEKEEFSKIGELLHALKIEKKQEIIPSLLDEIKIIVEKFDFSIYGKNIVVMPTHSSTKLVATTAKMIADKMNWDIQQNTIGIIEESHPTKIKRLETREAKLNELNGIITLWDEGIPEGKDVLLIDDNYQSGATINFISMLLKKYYNVKKVYGFCLTKTSKHFNPEEGGHYE